MPRERRDVREMSNMQTIYVVIGQTGEYSDRAEWLVRLATIRASQIEALPDCDVCESAWQICLCTNKQLNEHDARMQLECTGTSYRVETVEIDE